MFANNSANNQNSSSSAFKKNRAKRLIGLCAILGIAITLVATPAFAASWRHNNTAGASCTTPDTYCTQNNCAGFVDNNGDGICDRRDNCPQPQNDSRKSGSLTTNNNSHYQWGNKSGAHHMQARRCHHTCQ